MHRRHIRGGTQCLLFYLPCASFITEGLIFFSLFCLFVSFFFSLSFLLWLFRVVTVTYFFFNDLAIYNAVELTRTVSNHKCEAVVSLRVSILADCMSSNCFVK